jgi:ATP-dependent RNA helicase DDX55/SPB4
VQHDPPLEPDFFIHRVGRTARAGNRGKALVLLTPHERKYVDFLVSRRVPIASLADAAAAAAAAAASASSTTDHQLQLQLLLPRVRVSERAASDVHAAVRARVMCDRDLMEKGVRAFVSHVRAYREHRCRQIFKVGDLDFGRLARAYCLLRLPKMPELRQPPPGGGGGGGGKSKVRGFVELPQAVVDAIPYSNKDREKQRQAKLKRERENPPPPPEPRYPKGGNHQQQHNGKGETAEGGGGVDGAGAAQQPKRKRKGLHQRMMEEWNSLAKEERLYKKLKRGKISQEEYDRQMGDDEE